jgi:hypothetical protein
VSLGLVKVAEKYVLFSLTKLRGEERREGRLLRLKEESLKRGYGWLGPFSPHLIKTAVGKFIIIITIIIRG